MSKKSDFNKGFGGVVQNDNVFQMEESDVLDGMKELLDLFRSKKRHPVLDLIIVMSTSARMHAIFSHVVGNSDSEFNFGMDEMCRIFRERSEEEFVRMKSRGTYH